MECLRNPAQFPHFLSRVGTVLHELRDEYIHDLDSADNDVSTVSSSSGDTDRNNDDARGGNSNSNNNNDETSKMNNDRPDPQDNSSEGFSDDMTSHIPKHFHSEPDTHAHHSTTEMGSEEDTTDDPHRSGDGLRSADGDSPGDNAGDSPGDAPGDSDDSAGDSPRRKRDVDIEGFFDLEEMLDRLEEDDIECLATMTNLGDEKFLCHRFAHGSSVVFRMIMAAGMECDDYLLESDEDDNDDDDDDRLDESNQRTILNLFRTRPKEEIDDDEVRKLLRLAPDVLDDDFLESLPDRIFHSNMRELGRMASRRSGNPGLRYAFREKLDSRDLASLSADDMMGIGPGLRALRLDQIDRLNGSLLLQTNAAAIFMDGADGGDDDDDDDDEDDGVRIAFARRIKHHLRHSGSMTNQSISRQVISGKFGWYNFTSPSG
ncbi:hypothetical protein ElyMa_004857300 [Elysia marginata]|uniref:Uncharacterized protein n=1 Tax=Elysia marginata TaxID=1093978 RepID=A0AAV4IPN6_9GAST|nr:hypothetical protein ElyMa_004857300 [Elysia marginata]